MGLLDALNSDEARLGIGLLAAGGYSPTPMSVGQRVQLAMQGMDAQAQNKLKTKLMQSQIDENTSQNAARAAALDKQLQLSKMVQTLFGGGADTQPATSPGAFAPSADGMGPTMPPSMQAPQGQGGSRLAGLNIDQVAGLKAIGGPDLFEAYKWTKDPLQLQQGSTYVDRTTGQSKFMPKVGEGIAPDANGFYAPLPGYAASQGAIEGAKTGAIERAKAAFDPLTITPPNGKPIMTTRGAAVQSMGGGESGMRAQVQGGMGADPASIQREIAAVKSDLSKPLDAASKALLTEHLASLEAAAIRTPAPSGLAGIPLQSEADKASQLDTAKANVVRDSSKIADNKRYGQLTAGVDRAIDLLKSGPTASGMGAIVDAGQSFFGGSNKGADLASQLDTLSGWLTANVPRMEGPQSDKDVANYRIQAAAVGDRTKPVSQRLAAAQELKSLQDKYAELNGGAAAKTASANKSLKDYGYPNEAAAIKDAQNAMMKNPKAKAEIMRRLESMGISLNTGSF